VIACGGCWFCEKDLFSLCENGNTNPAITEMMWGQHPAGIFGYSHAIGGFKGSHAEFIRVPYADTVAFSVPEALDDQTALFASDSAPTGWMGADMGNVQPGDVVAVWGCGAAGRWQPGLRSCSAQSASSSSTGLTTGCGWPSSTSAPRHLTTRRPTSTPSCAR
jgi:threonine dehydrogenase-like Zn-dependent dehydrogenase